MEQSHRAGRGGSGAEGFELVFRWLDDQARDYRNAIAGNLAHKMTEHRVERVVALDLNRHVDKAQEQFPRAILGKVQTVGGHAPGNGAANVQQVGIAFGAGADDRVGKSNGVRFTPGDLLPKFWF